MPAGSRPWEFRKETVGLYPRPGDVQGGFGVGKAAKTAKAAKATTLWSWRSWRAAEAGPESDPVKEIKKIKGISPWEVIPLGCRGLCPPSPLAGEG
jgi:hypothetical protein